ncbi:MAG TPA: serine protein kinase PrkA, partial [Candidatus Ozemobacteraceae bacterium]|nr:serine protein kinase PrkA [Candidatus Ozemobacteraceae bacterium]
DHFGRIIVSSRIKKDSKAIKDWIDDDDDYEKCCDPDFLLLKMELYSGRIPDWLTKTDRNNLKADVWKSILAEAETEGFEGFSGRESNQVFDEFYSKYSKKRPINMRHVAEFFNDDKKSYKDKLPRNFIKHLTDLYDFVVLKEVKDSMYDYNEDEISKTILNYLVAITANIGDVVKNPWNNGEEITVTADFLDIVETHLKDPDASQYAKERYRKEAVDEYASVTLAREIKTEGKKITETKQYLDMFAAFTKSARQRVLEPYIANSNFRLAIKEFGLEDFQKYDTKIRDKVQLLFHNLHIKYQYNQECARAACLYVLDNNLVEKFK